MTYLNMWGIFVTFRTRAIHWCIIYRHGVGCVVYRRASGVIRSTDRISHTLGKIGPGGGGIRSRRSAPHAQCSAPEFFSSTVLFNVICHIIVHIIVWANYMALSVKLRPLPLYKNVHSPSPEQTEHHLIARFILERVPCLADYDTTIGTWYEENHRPDNVICVMYSLVGRWRGHRHRPTKLVMGPLNASSAH